MAWYKIYAGLGGSFGGSRYHGTYEYDNLEEAINDAYCLAEEEYQSYEGNHGILSWEDCYEDLKDSGFIDENMTDDEIEDIIADHYAQEIERWITYHVIEASGPTDIDKY